MNGNAIGALFVAFLLIFIGSIFAPILEDTLLDTRDSTGYNCANDADYNASMETNKTGCNIGSMISPLFLLFAGYAGYMLLMNSWKTQPEGY